MFFVDVSLSLARSQNGYIFNSPGQDYLNRLWHSNTRLEINSPRYSILPVPIGCLRTVWNDCFRVNHRPMQHSEFIKDDKGRQRYWARNYVGWRRFVLHQPNSIHRKLVEWERGGRVYWTVTQNVDALHACAGTKSLTELHGCLSRFE